MKDWFIDSQVEEEVTVTQYDVSAIPNDFNTMTIFNLIESGYVTLPLYQRNYVWDKNKASKLIESIILGLPIPPVYLYQEKKNIFQIIDGQQRLLSLYFFIKQRFPKTNKRSVLRKIIDTKSAQSFISDEILGRDDLFEDFKLTLPSNEEGQKNPLNGLKFHTLEKYKASFEIMTIRCVTIRQNEPEDDDGAIFEIFGRLNTGGMNLSSQEIRGYLYYSDFYNMLFELNEDKRWRRLLKQNDQDTRMKDIEFLLRSIALLFDGDHYKSPMNSFLNRFSKKAKVKFDKEYVAYIKRLYESFLDACSSLDDNAFIVGKGQFSIALFDCIFAAVAQNALKNKNLDIEKIDKESFENLKNDNEFSDVIQHSSSHTKSVKTRMDNAKKYLVKE